MWKMIATWRMAKEGMESVQALLDKGLSAQDALEYAIGYIEDFPLYRSVGYGGLPNANMEIELDAAFMDGTTLDIGIVTSLKNIKNPISVARSLSKHKVNNMLSGQGAYEYAVQSGFETRNMLSDKAKAYYEKHIEKETANPYIGHDTVGMICLDQDKNMVVGTSTSGLFLKKPGRIGDSPIIGSGFYADSKIGAAAASGLGEDIMKGIVSYKIVSLLDQGVPVQTACEKVVFEYHDLLMERRGGAGDLSVVAMDKDGNVGAASNIDSFSFCVMSDTEDLVVYRCKKVGSHMVHIPASQAWIEASLDEWKLP